jgi:sulfur-oxidizing protein SoxZ
MAKEEYRTRLRVKEKGGSVSVKAIVSHPMITGLTKDADGNKIPAHFINEVKVTVNDTVVMKALWGAAVSKDPYISFDYAGKSGDAVIFSWADNQGNTGSADTTVK